MPFGMHYSAEVYRDIFGVTDPNDVALAETFIKYAAKADAALLPAGGTHPCADLIREGMRSTATLLAYLGAPPPGCSALDAADALVQIYEGLPAPAEVRDALRERFHHAESDEERAAYTQALARLGDEELLSVNQTMLSADDPSIVRGAATILGLGRYRPAVPVLRLLVSPKRFVESDAVIWALGEIGDEAAVPELERALLAQFRMPEVLRALGAIGSLNSVPLLLNYLKPGYEPVQEAAYAALAMLLARQRDNLMALRDVRPTLIFGIRGQLEKEHTPSCKLAMLLCLARLGEKLDRAVVYRCLGMTATGEAAEKRSAGPDTPASPQPPAGASVPKRARTPTGAMTGVSLKGGGQHPGKKR
jgi:hypothetical protein